MYWFMVGYAVVVLLIGIMVVKMKIGQETQDATSRRYCPICRTELDQEDRLFADEMTNSEGYTELRIKGCNHCFKK